MAKVKPDAICAYRNAIAWSLGKSEYVCLSIT